ncbi:MAG TPA: zinc-dependent alcohol dehydrogenase family protein [Candidatus Tumulicola sp.]
MRVEDVADPRPGPGEVLLRVRACGVCRTDLHIANAELAPHRAAVVPGHQIVGTVEAIGKGVAPMPGAGLGDRVGVSWLGSVDGTCEQCRAGRENLCDAPVFTGYDRDGGYAQFVTARADFVLPLHEKLDDLRVAPLLCAGIIGFRALRVAGVERGERVGLFGFGSSAHLTLPVLQAWGCETFVATRGENHRAFAQRLGASWVGDAFDKPPVKLDRAVTFAPSGDVVIAALSSLRKGGVVAINAIHLDCIPSFEYDSLLWGERQIRSVANMTRQDGRDFLQLAAGIGIDPQVTQFSLRDAGKALEAIADDGLDGSAVLVA